MSNSAKFVHTNLIAVNWRTLANFYEQTLGCVPVYPERDLRGKELEAGTGIAGAQVQGIHLRLPGFEDKGPTLVIFNYNVLESRGATCVNRPGFGHIAFSVDDVAAAQKVIMRAGGKAVGEIVTMSISPSSKVTWCYVTDPEGNIIELHSWSDGETHPGKEGF